MNLAMQRLIGRFAPLVLVAFLVTSGATTAEAGRGRAAAAVAKRKYVSAKAALGRTATKAKGAFKRMPRKAKAAAAVVLVGATITGGLYVHGSKANEVWKDSPSRAAVVQVDQAVASRDSLALDRLGDSSRARRATLSRELSQAKATGAKKTSSGLSIGDAERELAFLGLAIAQADLEENALSRDFGERLGGVTPAVWSSRIQGMERAAISTGFDGRLALELRALSTELTSQEAAADGLDADLDRFGDRVPRAFGGEMRSELQSGQRGLERFRTEEIARERTVLSRAVNAMRGRVSNMLARTNPEFASHRGHWTNLARLQDQKSQPAAALAAEIDSDLGAVIRYRQSESTNLAIAATKTHVPVQKSRPATRSVYRDGQYVTESYTEYYTDYEDQSGIWRALAASDASSAQSHARDAERGLDRLATMVTALQRDSTLRTEGLVDDLPTGANTEVDQGSGAASAWFLPPLFSLFDNASSISRASDARTEFRPHLTALQRVNQTVGDRRGTEGRWVNGRITQDLDRQIAEVEAGQAPAGVGR